MKKNIIKLNVLVISILCNVSLFAQSNETILRDLNEILKSSLYKTEIKLSDDGLVNRMDNNGNTFEFNLKDIKEIKTDYDGFYNMLIVMDKRKKSKGQVNGREVESGINVVSFEYNDDCKKAIDLFKKLIE